MIRRFFAWLFRRRYRLPSHVTEYRFRPGMAMLAEHVLRSK